MLENDSFTVMSFYCNFESGFFKGRHRDTISRKSRYDTSKIEYILQYWSLFKISNNNLKIPSAFEATSTEQNKLIQKIGENQIKIKLYAKFAL